MHNNHRSQCMDQVIPNPNHSRDEMGKLQVNIRIQKHNYRTELDIRSDKRVMVNNLISSKALTYQDKNLKVSDYGSDMSHYTTPGRYHQSYDLGDKTSSSVDEIMKRVSSKSVLQKIAHPSINESQVIIKLSKLDTEKSVRRYEKLYK